MKIPRWFNRNRFTSIVRLVSASTLMCTAGAMAFVAANPSGSVSLGKSDQKATHHSMSPALRLESQEALANVENGGGGPQFQLFTCQVGLSSIPGRQCYDPYQMRHAYGVDSLIAAGFDGTGHTIVIVDAFQNPTLVSQIDFYNTFYGLPPTSLTQIAPDGLTPFDPNDGNMVSWPMRSVSTLNGRTTSPPVRTSCSC